jgi:hypothetical protein
MRMDGKAEDLKDRSNRERYIASSSIGSLQPILPSTIHLQLLGESLL